MSVPGKSGGRTAAGLLGLAATPVFAIMALLTQMAGADADMLCSAAHGGSVLGGMVPMYLLMSVFHAAPWMKLILRRQSIAAAQIERGYDALGRHS